MTKKFPTPIYWLHQDIRWFDLILLTARVFILQGILQRGEIFRPADCTRRSIFFDRRLQRSADLSTTRRSVLMRGYLGIGGGQGEGWGFVVRGRGFEGLARANQIGNGTLPATRLIARSFSSAAPCNSPAPRSVLYYLRLQTVNCPPRKYIMPYTYTLWGSAHIFRLLVIVSVFPFTLRLLPTPLRPSSPLDYIQDHRWQDS